MQNIIVLDFGTRYLPLVTRRLRELGVHYSVLPHDATIEQIERHNPAGFILSGSPDSVYLPDSRKLNLEIMNLNLPILGICYGLQLLAYHFGGQVASMGFEEIGPARVRQVASSNLVDRYDNGSSVWMRHGDYVAKPPHGFKVTATANNRICIVEDSQRRIYGVQFHPEVAHCPIGSKLLVRYIYMCGIERDTDHDYVIFG